MQTKYKNLTEQEFRVIQLLTEIRDEMKKYNDKTDAKLEKVSKRRWF